MRIASHRATPHPPGADPMSPMPGGTLTSVTGIRVGHWTDVDARTGCTVVVLPEPNVAAAEVRGAAPATRELGLLQMGMTVQGVQAIVLTGGSAFGLASADGVMAALEADGRGYPTRGGNVPIVPAAALFDLAVGDGAVRPGPGEGRAAYADASDRPVEHGAVGAGTGAMVAKWRGDGRPGGLGSAAVRAGDATVAAIAAVNATGDVFAIDGAPLTGGSPVPPQRPAEPPVGEHTTLLLVATDAALDRERLSRVCVRAHDALGACLRPAHTAFDGDICFAVSTGDVDEPAHVIAEAAFEAVALAIEAAVRR